MALGTRLDLSRSKFHSKAERSIVEVCESDPNPIGFWNQNINFGSD